MTRFHGLKNPICGCCGKPWPCKCMATGEIYKKSIRNAALEEAAKMLENGYLYGGWDVRDGVVEIVTAIRELKHLDTKK